MHEIATSRLRPEIRLAVELLAMPANLPAAERVLSETIDFDWEFFLLAIEKHGVVLAIRDQLSQLALPDWVNKRLKRLEAGLWFRNTAIVGELFALNSQFERQGITPLFFKGPVTAFNYYDGFFNREFGDLDILVRPDESLRLLRLLSDRGYAPTWSNKPVPWAILESPRLFQLGYEVSMKLAGTTLDIDVHWVLRPEWFLGIDPELAHSDATCFTSNGSSFGCLSSEWLVFYHSFNGVLDEYEKLSGLSDLYRILTREKQFDWEKFDLLASKTGTTRIHAITFDLLFLLFGFETRPDRPNCSAGQAERSAISQMLDLLNKPIRPIAGRGRRTLRRGWILRDGLVHRLRAVTGRVLLPELGDYQRLPLPHWASAGYYVIHPLTILWNFAGFHPPSTRKRTSTRARTGPMAADIAAPAPPGERDG